MQNVSVRSFHGVCVPLDQCYVFGYLADEFVIRTGLFIGLKPLVYNIGLVILHIVNGGILN